ncbi:MAG: hypothetical protein JW885_02300 [Deltaproteobacteria bacterium]|nr:hypothetical protein [Candidatus Zymogenaceae bacterium]
MKSISVRYRAVIAFMVIFLISMTAGAFCGDSVLLVTAEEAAQPSIRAAGEEKNDGPVISIHSPENDATLSGTFRLYIEVEKKEDGADVLMDSLKVRYLKVVPIDITDRVRDYISGTSLDVPNAEFPAGNHRTEIYIEDAEGYASSKVFHVEVVEAE